MARAAATLLLSLPAAGVLAGAYEATLPPELSTAPAPCALIDCTEVFPGATRFSERKGRPPYVEAYGDEADPQQPGGRKLLGYVMLSTDITDTPAYSGKPVVTLVGMDVQGRYVGVKALKHSEPILLLGIPESALVDFNRQYIGKAVTDRIEVGPARPEENVLGVDAISGATVTVIAQNQVMHQVGSAVARQVGIIAPTARPPARYAANGRRHGWNELVALGAVQRLRVMPEQVGLERGAEPFIELWFGDLNHPDVGASLLGERGFASLRSRLADGEHALFVIRSAGAESFKGSGFVRGGIYDRIQVKQGADAFTFRDLDYLNLYGLEAAGAPRHTESGIFVIRSSSFSASYPWALSFLGNRVDRATGHRSFAVFESKLWLADALLEGGRPVVAEPEAPWVRIWKMRAVEIGLFSALLIAVGVVYALRERLTRRSTHRNKWPVNAFKYSAWALSIGFVGFGLLAQPSITQVLTWFHSLLFQWTWSLFLSDPFIFVFWIFIIVTVFLFGRGLFCGWLCPFGSLSEAIYKVGRALGLGRWQRALPRAVHDRLKWLKYAIFFGLLAVSMYSMTLAEMLAEVEPFKTTFLVGITQRAWPYGLFVCVLLGLSLFIERPYCKYLCPLGAALAMPSTFRWFGLRRKQDCNRCKACATGCGSQAIDAAGRIDHRECLHCLDCMVLYTDVGACPPLAKERKLRERGGLAITPIGKDGYFIPIVPVAATAASATAAAAAAASAAPAPRAGPDPRMPTDPVEPASLAGATGILHRLALEVREHLWPWSATGWRDQRALQIAGFSLAVAASVAWLLAGTGRLSSGALIGWWFGWSVYEVLIRLTGRRYVKDGPWWRSRYRYAGVMDMLSYVGFKNLLIGAALFLMLKGLGLLGA
ncbi:MAG TPA: 4Fe-4S binding protein [Burkholderiaceae bacterium]|nr:4Fe-4S binding protein [Burkholderiaceae bacterium]